MFKFAIVAIGVNQRVVITLAIASCQISLVAVSSSWVTVASSSIGIDCFVEFGCFTS